MAHLHVFIVPLRGNLVQSGQQRYAVNKQIWQGQKPSQRLRRSALLEKRFAQTKLDLEGLEQACGLITLYQWIVAESQ